MVPARSDRSQRPTPRFARAWRALFLPAFLWGLPAVAVAQVQNINPVVPDVPLIKVPLEDACQIRLVEGRLVFTTKVPYTGVAPRPVEIPGLAGESRVTYRPYRFILENQQDAADGAHVTLNVERRRTYFRYQRTVRTGTVERTITFTQSYSDDDTIRMQAGHVKLAVVVDGELLDNIDSADFLTLRREHPRAFYRELVPSLRLLKAEQLFSVDPWEARQVLTERVPPEAVPEVVRTLVADLGAKSFRDRERAVRRLAALGQTGVEALKKIDPTTLSPEQSMAVEVLQKKHQPMSLADADRLRSDYDFLLDCLYSDEEDVTAPAAARIESLSGKKPPVDLASAPDERALQIEALRTKLVPSPTTQTTSPATRP